MTLIVIATSLKLVGLTKSFEMSMHNNCSYWSICNALSE